MRMKLLLTTVVLGGLAVALGFAAKSLFDAPLYVPGAVRAGTNLCGALTPPPQPSKGGYWQVEDDIQLAYDSLGAGRPVLVLHGGPGFPFREPLAGLQPLA